VNYQLNHGEMRSTGGIGGGNFAGQPSGNMSTTYIFVFTDVTPAESEKLPPADPALESQVRALEITSRAAKGPLPDDEVDRELLLHILLPGTAECPAIIQEYLNQNGKTGAECRVGALRLFARPKPNRDACLPVLVTVLTANPNGLVGNGAVANVAVAALNEIMPGKPIGEFVLDKQEIKTASDPRSKFRLSKVSSSAVVRAAEIQCPFPPKSLSHLVAALHAIDSPKADSLASRQIEAALDTPVTLAPPYPVPATTSAEDKRHPGQIHISSGIRRVLEQVGLALYSSVSFDPNGKHAKVNRLLFAKPYISPTIHARKCRDALDEILHPAGLTWRLQGTDVILEPLE
jgi:hypothetical protein